MSPRSLHLSSVALALVVFGMLSGCTLGSDSAAVPASAPVGSPAVATEAPYAAPASFEVPSDCQPLGGGPGILYEDRFGAEADRVPTDSVRFLLENQAYLENSAGPFVLPPSPRCAVWKVTGGGDYQFLRLEYDFDLGVGLSQIDRWLSAIGYQPDDTQSSIGCGALVSDYRITETSSGRSFAIRVWHGPAGDGEGSLVEWPADVAGRYVAYVDILTGLEPNVADVGATGAFEPNC